MKYSDYLLGENVKLFSRLQTQKSYLSGRVLTSNIADAYTGGFLISGKEQVACGNGICEQCVLEQIRSLGQKDGMVGLHLQELPVQERNPPMEPSQSSPLGLDMKVTLLVMGVVLT